jgi:hypothetical protein
MAGFNLHKVPLLSHLLTRRQPADRRRTFSLVPLRNPMVDWEPRENGPVCIHVPLQRRPAPRPLLWIAAKLARKPPPDRRALELDPVGSFVWRAADGRRTVRQLIWLLAAEYRLNRKDAEVALLEFMRQLSSRNLLGFGSQPQVPADQAD